MNKFKEYAQMVIFLIIGISLAILFAYINKHNSEIVESYCSERNELIVEHDVENETYICYVLDENQEVVKEYTFKENIRVNISTKEGISKTEYKLTITRHHVKTLYIYCIKV